jgi:hypothetical protein
MYFREVKFCPSLRGFLDVTRGLFGSRDILPRCFFDTAREYLSAAISWLTF